MKIVFLDRDGVINKYPGDDSYVTSWKEFVFLPGAIDAIKKLNKAGFKVCVVSNQSGVGRGLFSQDSLNEITQKMLSKLKAEGAVVDCVSYCTHTAADNCPCRKPRTGLIDKAVKLLAGKSQKLDLSRCFFVGDSIVDVKTGRSAGLKTIVVFSGKEKPRNKSAWDAAPDHTASDLREAVDIILR
ncbi:MAG: HAD family hydrolase [Candidatus Omnitrophica bacterium]|nr:HAD family hydrolase [Candidatus Omnitrophota bacterium]